MCRHLAYVGAEVTLASLVTDPPHGLVRQAKAPRHQPPGRINADGFGVGWYAPDVRPEPARYRRTVPIWTDPSFASLAGVVRAPAFLAAIRAASLPDTIDESCTAPFTAGRWLFSHNGVVKEMANGAGDRLRALLPPGTAVESAVDSALLWALVLRHLDAGAAPAAAVADVVRAVAAVAEGRFNLLLTDGTRIAGTTYGDTLFTLAGPGGVVVASEPYDDDPAWRAVPPCSVVAADASGVTVVPL